MRILGLKRGGEILRGDIEEHVLGAGDQLVVSSSPAELASLAEAYDFRTGLTGVGGGVVTAGPERPRDLSLVEAVVSSAHPIIGRRLADIPLLSKLRVRVLGLSRPRHVAGPELAEVRVRAGDRLLIAAGEDATQALQANVLLGTVTQTPARAFRRDRAPIAIATLAAVVLVAAVFALPIQALALLGAGIVLATRCLEPEEAWSAIDGNTLVLIFGMLAFGTALENAGTVELLVRWAQPLFTASSPVLILLAVYALGLGIPFLLVAAFLPRLTGTLAWMKRNMERIERIMGLLLWTIGLLMLTGGFSAMSYWLLETFPGLATLG